MDLEGPYYPFSIYNVHLHGHWGKLLVQLGLYCVWIVTFGPRRVRQFMGLMNDFVDD